MLTGKTQKAIVILHEIAYHDTRSCPNGGDDNVCVPTCVAILKQLQDAGIIRLLPDHKPGYFQSYEMCMELTDISLYQLLIAIGEGINLIAPSSDEDRIYKYYHYGTAASKLGVVNHMLRTLLCDVTMSDL